MGQTVKRKRVVVTGMGVVSPLGQDLATFRSRLMSKVCAIKPSPHYSTYFENANAAELVEPVVLRFGGKELPTTIDKAALWALATGAQALDQAGLTGQRDMLRDAGLVIGVSSAGTEAYMPVIEKDADAFSAKKVKYSGAFGSCCAIVASVLGLEGGFELVATACTASTNALGLAFDSIQSDRHAIVLVSGTEPLYLPTFAGFYALNAMKDTACSPFSGKPGMSIGEGAGSIVLEEYEHARRRNAPIYAELAGYATSGDAYHETAPDPRANGALQVMKRAMSNAGVKGEDIDYVNAHGTGTEANDRAETNAMKKVFGTRQTPIALSSTKSYFGHNIGAAGILEVVACLAVLPQNKLLPTLNFTEPRSGLDLDYVANDFADKDVAIFMKNNYAFGGNNCSLIMTLKPERLPATFYERQRIYITGAGMVSALGVGAEACFDAAARGLAPSRVQVNSGAGDCGMEELLGRWLEHNPASAEFASKLPYDDQNNLSFRVYEVPEIDPRHLLKGVNFRKVNRVSAHALIASELAMRQAGLKLNRESENDVGIVFGVCNGPQATVSRFMNSLYIDPNNISTIDFASSLMNTAATACSITKSIKGYNTTLATGYHASLGAIIYGFDILRQNLQKQMIVGGVDENFYGGVFAMNKFLNDANFDTGENAQRVYSRSHPGFCMGEGGAMVILESEQAVIDRNVEPLAEVIGVGKANSTEFLDDRIGAGSLATSIRRALTDANIDPGSIDVIIGNSWGGEKSDTAEIEAIKTVFADAAGAIPITNYNGYYGFVEAAGAAMSVVGAIDAMRNDRILPIVHTRDFATDDLLFVSSEALRRPVRHALVIAASNSGNDYALVLKRCRP
jgi:3-oxoacyl-(acyl-carrier-protein) synthase